MAHDFTATFSDGNKVFFFGYAGGILYDVFNANDFDMGVSGSGETKLIDYTSFIDAIEKIKTDKHAINYPDPDRFPEFFHDIEEAIKSHNPEKKIELCFS